MPRRQNNTKSVQISKSPPPTQTPAPAPAVPNQSSIGSSMMNNVLNGITFGAGSSIGHRVIDGIMGNSKVEVEPNINQSNIQCEKLFELYNTCLKNEREDCSHLQDIVKMKCTV